MYSLNEIFLDQTTSPTLVEIYNEKTKKYIYSIDHHCLRQVLCESVQQRSTDSFRNFLKKRKKQKIISKQRSQSSTLFFPTSNQYESISHSACHIFHNDSVESFFITNFHKDENGFFFSLYLKFLH